MQSIGQYVERKLADGRPSTRGKIVVGGQRSAVSGQTSVLN